MSHQRQLFPPEGGHQSSIERALEAQMISAAFFFFSRGGGSQSKMVRCCMCKVSNSLRGSGLECVRNERQIYRLLIVVVYDFLIPRLLCAIEYAHIVQRGSKRSSVHMLMVVWHIPADWRSLCNELSTHVVNK